MRSKAWLAARQSFSRTLRSQKTLNIFQWVQNLGTRRFCRSKHRPTNLPRSSVPLVEVCTSPPLCEHMTHESIPKASPRNFLKMVCEKHNINHDLAIGMRTKRSKTAGATGSFVSGRP
jgi:hypothetical protein